MTYTLRGNNSLVIASVATMKRSAFGIYYFLRLVDETLKIYQGNIIYINSHVVIPEKVSFCEMPKSGFAKHNLKFCYNSLDCAFHIISPTSFS